MEDLYFELKRYKDIAILSGGKWKLNNNESSHLQADGNDTPYTTARCMPLFDMQEI